MPLYLKLLHQHLDFLFLIHLVLSFSVKFTTPISMKTSQNEAEINFYWSFHIIINSVAGMVISVSE